MHLSSHHNFIPDTTASSYLVRHKIVICEYANSSRGLRKVRSS